jgi:hypothetical protein
MVERPCESKLVGQGGENFFQIADPNQNKTTSPMVKSWDGVCMKKLSSTTYLASHAENKP